MKCSGKGLTNGWCIKNRVERTLRLIMFLYSEHISVTPFQKSEWDSWFVNYKLVIITCVRIELVFSVNQSLGFEMLNRLYLQYRRSWRKLKYVLIFRMFSYNSDFSSYSEGQFQRVLPHLKTTQPLVHHLKNAWQELGSSLFVRKNKSGLYAEETPW